MMSLEVILLLCAFTVHSTTSQPVLETNVNNLGIIGGHNVSIEDAPFIAALLTNEGTKKIHVCGGSIIHKQFILTAAHCCVGYEVLEIRVGSVEFNQSGKVYIAANISTHELYQIELHDYDICVIKLNDTLKFGPTISKIALADDKLEINDGANLTTIGWGDTDEDNPGLSASSYLLEVSVPFVSKCQADTFYYISPRMLCAGAKNNSAYYGDSGGPLTMKNSILVGITSFGPKPFRGVTAFVKITSLIPWIKETMKKLL